MFWYVYILFSPSAGKFYTGISKDWQKRLAHHNSGRNAWSKRGVPWQLIYFEAYTNKTDAYKREKFLKSGVGRDYIKNQIAHTIFSLSAR